MEQVYIPLPKDSFQLITSVGVGQNHILTERRERKARRADTMGEQIVRPDWSFEEPFVLAVAGRGDRLPDWAA